MDEMLADLISEGTIEGLEAARARGRTLVTLLPNSGHAVVDPLISRLQSE